MIRINLKTMKERKKTTVLIWFKESLSVLLWNPLRCSFSFFSFYAVLSVLLVFLVLISVVILYLYLILLPSYFKPIINIWLTDYNHLSSKCTMIYLTVKAYLTFNGLPCFAVINNTKLNNLHVKCFKHCTLDRFFRS